MSVVVADWPAVTVPAAALALSEKSGVGGVGGVVVVTAWLNNNVLPENRSGLLSPLRSSAVLEKSIVSLMPRFG